MNPVVVLLFAFFGGVAGQGNSGGAFTIPAIYRGTPAAVDLTEILADVPANTGTSALEELISGGDSDTPAPTLGQITGALDLGAVEGFDSTAPLAPITNAGDTIPFAFEPSGPPAFTPDTPALPAEAQNIFSGFVPPTTPTTTPTDPGTPPVETPPAETPIINIPEDISDFQGFGEEFTVFQNFDFGQRKGSFETVGKENVLDDILSED